MRMPASSAAVPLPPPTRRTAFLSDTHIGSKHRHAAELAMFLETLRCDRLYLVGDIVDLWWLSHRRAHWQASHQRVIEALHALRRAGTDIVYIPGNHDRPMRRFCGLALPAMRVRRRAVHVTADGRRLLVVHGDEFDAPLGVPIVSTAVMGTATVLRDAASALVAPEHVEGFAAQVTRVLRDAQLRALLSAAGPRDARAWSHDALMQRVLNVYGARTPASTTRTAEEIA